MQKWLWILLAIGVLCVCSGPAARAGGRGSCAFKRLRSAAAKGGAFVRQAPSGLFERAGRVIWERMENRRDWTHNAKEEACA